MSADIYMIILTSFALFGLFCLTEQIIMSVKFSKAPKSVTVILGNKSFSTYDTIQYIHNALYNNEIVILSEKAGEEYPLATTLTTEELHTYITNALFTKK